METVFAVLFALIATVSCTSYKAAEKPKGVSDEMYCLGCELTVKELDFVLRRKPTRGMGETVTRALDKVCDKANFEKYEVKTDLAVKVCKAIIVDEGMEALLITDYGRKHELGKHFTHLEMTQKICGTLLKACYTPDMIENTEDGGITYNSDTEDFVVKKGHKVRSPNPVREKPDSTGNSTPESTKTEGLKKKPVVVTNVKEAQESHDEL